MDSSNNKHSIKLLCDSLAFSLQSKESRDALKADSLFRKKVNASETSMPFDRLQGQRMKSENTGSSIGIWSKNKNYGKSAVFIRNEDLFPRFGGNEHAWADAAGFSLEKDHRQRIVYLGESVARGFVFDPIMTPADVLSDMLNESVGDFEIIDLACTGINGSSLLKVAQESLQLKPNYLIVHAGNNWWNAFWGIDNQNISQILYGMSCYEIAETIINQTVIYTKFIMDSLIGFTESIGAKLIFVLPEYNYLGWTNEFVTPSWLTEKELEIWLNNICIIETYIAREDFQSAEELCKKTLEVDQGMCAYSLELMARIYYENGNNKLARRFFIKAKDTLCWQSQVNTPRCPSYIEKTIRESISQARNAELIDLPNLLTTDTKKEIPSPHWFVDYVHHSPAGILFIAQQLTRTISDRLDESFNYCFEEESLASGYFLSALHNANYSQNESIVKDWLIKAKDLNFFSEKNQTDLFFFLNDFISQNVLVQEIFKSSDLIIDKFINAFKLSYHSGRRLRHIYSDISNNEFDNVIPLTFSPDNLNKNWIDQKDINNYRTIKTGTPVFMKMEYVNCGYILEMQPISYFRIPVDSHKTSSVVLCAKLWPGDTECEFIIIINGKKYTRSLKAAWKNYNFEIDSLDNYYLDISIEWPLLHNPLAYKNNRDSELLSGRINLSMFKVYGCIASFFLKN